MTVIVQAVLVYRNVAGRLAVAMKLLAVLFYAIVTDCYCANNIALRNCN